MTTVGPVHDTICFIRKRRSRIVYFFFLNFVLLTWIFFACPDIPLREGRDCDTPVFQMIKLSFDQCV